MSVTEQLFADAFSPKKAWISTCGRYRYLLSRRWAPGPRRVLFAMINPSSADAVVDDATVRKIVGFSRRWGSTS